jgi:hypothetical protein
MARFGVRFAVIRPHPHHPLPEPSSVSRHCSVLTFPCLSPSRRWPRLAHPPAGRNGLWIHFCSGINSLLRPSQLEMQRREANAGRHQLGLGDLWRYLAASRRACCEGRAGSGASWRRTGLQGCCSRGKWLSPFPPMKIESSRLNPLCLGHMRVPSRANSLSNPTPSTILRRYYAAIVSIPFILTRVWNLLSWLVIGRHLYIILYHVNIIYSFEVLIATWVHDIAWIIYGIWCIS